MNSDSKKPFLQSVSKTALDKNAAFRSDSNALCLTVVIGVANWFVSSGAFVEAWFDGLAFAKIEMQLDSRQSRLGGCRRFG
jgi:hypothetical protein